MTLKIRGKMFLEENVKREVKRGQRRRMGTWELLDHNAKSWISGVQAGELDTNRSVPSKIQCAKMHTL